MILAYVCGEPTKSKTDSNKIFEELYYFAFDANSITAELIIAAHRCHQAIEYQGQKAITWQKSVTRNSLEETWVIEGPSMSFLSSAS